MTPRTLPKYGDYIVPAGSPRCILIDGRLFPEAPRWRDGRLWFSEMFAGCVRLLRPEGGRLVEAVDHLAARDRRRCRGVR